MYTLQIVLFTLHSNCYFLFLPRTFVYLENSNYDLVDGFQFFIPYSTCSTCTNYILIRLFLLYNKMQSTITMNCLLELALMRHFQLGWGY